jgi:predicted transcriptional regulator
MNMQEFLKELDNMEIEEQLSEKGLEFYKQLKEKSQTTFTENGKKILKCMQQNVDNYKTFNSKQIGELLFMPPRSVSGSIKKLISEGYCIKVGVNPVCYELTALGKETQLD